MGAWSAPRVSGSIAVAALGAVVLTLLLAPEAETTQPPPAAEGTRHVLFVANNWDGTADVVDPRTLRKLGRLDIVPDLQKRLEEIYANPVRLGYFLGIRQVVGEGNDQYADDMFSSHDGRYVYVSRPSLADVVAIDLRTNAIVWRVPMEGQRSDHMAMSPDGTRLLVSDSTARQVLVIDPREGKVVGNFESGDTPHENNYSKDGSRIFHASIGLVYTPTDQPWADSTKGDRWFQVVDAGTNQVVKRLDIGAILEEHGYPDMSSAVRPMAISPDEKTAYLQLSFLHGFVEFDLENDRPKRIATLPQSDKAKATPREDYLLDSAHHGLAINPEGTKLCAAGTMSDYAAIVSAESFDFTRIDVGPKPYWATNSADGRLCFVSVSGSDEIVAIDYETEREVARIPVGDHPQRMRIGVIREEYLTDLRTATPRPRRAARLQVLRTRVRDGELRLRLRVAAAARGRLRVRYGGATRFTTRIPRRSGSSVTWRVRRALAPSDRGRTTGLLDVRFGGDPGVAPDRVRLRAGRRPARLRVVDATIDDRDRLTVRGRIARRARESVRVRLTYSGRGSRLRTITYRARIRGGRWGLRAVLPGGAARSGGHLSVEYPGGRARGIRGEQRIVRLRP